MKNILIKPKEHKIEGEGETLGKDYDGNSYTYWKSGVTEVPIELALQLEKEVPQRFMIDEKDRGYVKFVGDLFKGINIKVEKPIKPIIEPIVHTSPMPEPLKIIEHITLEELKNMTKDSLNDWAAKRDYNVNTADKKSKMIKKLVKQIEKRTGKKVR